MSATCLIAVLDTCQTSHSGIACCSADCLRSSESCRSKVSVYVQILNRIQSLEADMRALRALKVQIGQSGVNAKDEQRSQSRESPRAAQRDGR